MEATRTFYVNEVKEFFKKHLYHCNKFKAHNSILQVYGPARCGKTSLVLKAINNRPNVSYFSFAGLSEKEAIRLFAAEAFWFTGIAAENNWESIFETYKYLNNSLHQFLILDDIDQTLGYKDFHNAFVSFLNDEKRKRIFIVVIGEKAIFGEDEVSGVEYSTTYLALSDARQLVPNMDSYNALLVYTATGGIPELCKLFSDYSDFDSAVSDILRFDSDYYNFMPKLMEKHFRKPGTYNAILHAVACGAEKIGEISEAVGEPNNKCDKYCRALIDCRILNKNDGEYYFANCYFELWYRHMYPNIFALRRPEKAPEFIDKFICDVKEKAENEFVLAAYRHAMVTNWGYDIRMATFDKHPPIPINVPVNGKNFYFDVVICDDDEIKCSFVKVYHGKDFRLDRDATLELEAAASEIAPLCDARIEVYSYTAFKDFPVRQAAKYDYLHLNALERLKWRW